MCRRAEQMRWARWPGVVSVIAAVVVLWASPASAQADRGVQDLANIGPVPTPCDLPLVTDVCDAVPNPLDAVPNPMDVVAGVPDAVAGVPGAIADGVAESFARWIASGAAGVLQAAGDAIFAGTDVSLVDSGEGGRRWFVERYDRMAVVGLGVFAPMLMLAVLHATFTQSPGLLARAVANLPVAALGTAAAVAVVELLLAVTDNVSAFVADGMGADTENFLSGIIAALLAPSPALGLFGVALLSMFMAFAAFVVWLELIVREAAIYLTVLFLPIGFATYIWPALSSWLRRLFEVIVALILSKLVIVAALSLASSALAAQEGFGALVGGAGMLLLAAFAPFALFKLIPIASMAAISSLEGQGRRGVRGAVPRASTAFYARQLANGSKSPSRATVAGPGSPGGGTAPGGGGGPGRPGGSPAGGGALGTTVAKGGGAAGRGGAGGAGAAGGPVAAGAAAGAAAARSSWRAATAQSRKAAAGQAAGVDGGEG